MINRQRLAELRKEYQDYDVLMTREDEAHFLRREFPHLLHTLSALLTVKEAAEYVICWHKPGSIVGWDELTKALAAVKEGAPR